jgi:hypothetical protein
MMESLPVFLNLDDYKRTLYTHNGNPCSEVVIEELKPYNPDTEEAGCYCAIIIDTVEEENTKHEHFPSEEASACWVMEQLNITELTPIP